MKNPLHVLAEERRHFQSYPLNMRILLLTNLIYALVLPLLELFVGAYILRESGDTSLVVIYQLAVYTGILFSFLLNGYALRVIPIAKLYSFGMLMSGAAMTFMMLLPELHLSGVALTGLLMGTSYGFFWSNRDFLSLSSTDDSNRNYYFSLETVFYTLTFIVMPLLGGLFISLGETRNGTLPGLLTARLRSWFSCSRQSLPGWSTAAVSAIRRSSNSSTSVFTRIGTGCSSWGLQGNCPGGHVLLSRAAHYGQGRRRGLAGRAGLPPGP